MLITKGRYIYVTYLVYKYLDKYIQDEDLQEIKELNFKIFPENEHLCRTVYKINDKASIMELKYKLYSLIYIVDDKNVFLVNVLSSGQDYPKDLSVIFYGLDTSGDFVRKLDFNNQDYFCLNIGKAYIEFNKQRRPELQKLKRSWNVIFWERFEKFIRNGSAVDNFSYRVFDNVIIVYKYTER